MKPWRDLTLKSPCRPVCGLAKRLSCGLSVGGSTSDEHERQTDVSLGHLFGLALICTAN